MLCRSKTILYNNAAEISCLKLGKNISRNSSLKNLGVFLDHDGLLKIHARIGHLTCRTDVIVLPKDHHGTQIIVKDAHEKEASITYQDYGYSTAKYVICAKNEETICKPENSTNGAVASSKTCGQKIGKRWGVLFTCLSTRAVHIEVAHSLDTGSCIMCLRNFIGRRDEARIVKEFDEIKWIFNSPATPHMGCAWERLV
ncbi:hypothetical protein EVAR_73987_1 [Eumeta japonica]|uniref:Uncharacterized protein n=1 Tax=Eumeta variegata TaxID=151549 RepID=A0A4C1STA9_EUMVA|nr:hypothetical protein EVAR_73987_1 [Eumeta japonica]